MANEFLKKNKNQTQRRKFFFKISSLLPKEFKENLNEHIHASNEEFSPEEEKRLDTHFRWALSQSIQLGLLPRRDFLKLSALLSSSGLLSWIIPSAAEAGGLVPFAFIKKPTSSQSYADDVFSSSIYTGNGGLQTINTGITLATGSGWSTSVFSDTSGAPSYSDGVKSLCYDSSGNFYAVMKNTVLKLDSTNNIIWQKTVNSFSPVAAAVNGSTGDLYAVGYSGGGNSHQIIKFDSTGNISWQNSLSGNASQSCGSVCVSVGASGNIYIGGYATRADAAGYYALMYKLNSSGTMQWQTQYFFGPNAKVRAIKFDSSENLYIAIQGSSGGGSNAYVAKFNSSGTMSWCNSITVPAADTYTSIYTQNSLDIDSSGNIYCAITDYSSRSALVKLDSTGAFQWSRSFGTNLYGGNVAVDSSNNIYMATVDSKRTVVKYDPSGNVLWKKTIALNSDYALSQYDNGGLLTLGDKLYIYGTDSDLAGSNTGYPVIVKIKQDGTSMNGGAYVNMSDSALTITNNPITAVANAGITFSASSYTLNTTSFAASSGTFSMHQFSITDQTASNGGLIWIKDRTAAEYNRFFDTVRGATKVIYSNATNQQGTEATALTSFNANGFSIDSIQYVNRSGDSYVAWTFRKAAKFFDIVTYTGTGTTQVLSHNLNISPGMVIIKALGTNTDWVVWHRGIPSSNGYLNLDLINAQGTFNGPAANVFGNTSSTVDPTATQFTIGNNASVNSSGVQYIAYLFAHDTSTNGLVQCGSYAGYNGTNDISLGWEPQWLMIKNATETANGSWWIFDNTRGYNTIEANSSNSESNAYANVVSFTATGFEIRTTNQALNYASDTYAYIAIRNPNKPVTTGLQVYNAIERTGTGGTPTIAGAGFSPDLVLSKNRGTGDTAWWDKIRGATRFICSSSTAAEVIDSIGLTAFTQDGFVAAADTTNNYINNNTYNYIYHFFRRARGVFDIVSYTGTGSSTTVTHNLGVAPELLIVKNRSNTGTGWYVWVNAAGVMDATGFLRLDQAGAANANGYPSVWNSQAPSSTVINLGSNSAANGSTYAYVAYLFATKAGVSKVGSYTGNGSTQTINCGFTSPARFIMIKRTDSTGDWYVWSARQGIITSSNDPHISLNTTSAEATSYDSIDPDSSGFIAKQNGTTNINTSSAIYIFLAIS
ncbi:MAG: DUF7483 domain-containing protein [Pseudobdellovibrionaceae bacterium]